MRPHLERSAKCSVVVLPHYIYKYIYIYYITHTLDQCDNLMHYDEMVTLNISIFIYQFSTFQSSLDDKKATL